MALVGKSLADRQLYSGSIRFEGRFFPAGAGVPTAPNAVGWSVVRTSQSLYTVTLLNTKLANVAPGFFSHRLGPCIVQLCSVQETGTLDVVARFGDFTAATAVADATVVIKVMTGAAVATDLGANANNSVSFALKFLDTTVTK